MYRRRKQSLAKVLEIEDPATPIMLNDDLIFAMEITLAIDDLTAIKHPLFASLDRNDSDHVYRVARIGQVAHGVPDDDRRS